jgi:hypothetical protein
MYWHGLGEHSPVLNLSVEQTFTACAQSTKCSSYLTGVVSLPGCYSNSGERPSHPCDALVVVESFVNVTERRVHVMKLLLIREQLLFVWKRGRIFHCPGEQRRCHYSLGQTMLLSWNHLCLSRVQRSDEQSYPLPLWKIMCGRTIKPWLWFWSLLFNLMFTCCGSLC